MYIFNFVIRGWRHGRSNVKGAFEVNNFFFFGTFVLRLDYLKNMVVF